MNKQILKGVIFSGLFAVPFIPFLVSSSLFFPFITTKAFAWRIIVEIVFAAWAILALSNPEYRPKRSWILYGLLTFIAVIGLADLLGVEPVKSFWSNAERMEGFVSLLHLGMFFAVVSSVFDPANWRRWWNTSIIASFIMVIYCIFQLLGAIEIRQGGARVDGTFGNAAYLAVYLLFHVFVSIYFLVQNKIGTWKWAYVAAIVANSSILYFTATRGALLGLLGGLLIAALLSLRNKESRRMKRFGQVYLGAFLLLLVGFVALKDTALIQGNMVLSRFANVSIEELKGEGRAFVWPIAVEGIKERPILGWGQDNFNYVFNNHYSGQMYHLEPWFDRAHNIFLDWGISGGILGLLSYLSLYALLLWYLWRPASSFTYSEKSILTGLVAAYFFHNFFVFDHLISYVLFMALLAFVDAHNDAPRFSKNMVREETSATIAGPIAGIALIAVLYFVNIRPMSANATLISALQNLSNERSTELLEKAYNTSRLGRLEIIEQIGGNAPAILSQESISMEKRNEFFAFARSVVEKQADDFPDDARYQVLAADLLMRTGQFDESIVYFNRALELMPEKQMIYLQLASALINKKDYQGALATLKRAYELAPEFQLARVSYLVGAIYAGDRALESELIGTLPGDAYVKDERLVNAYLANNRFSDLVAIFRKRIEINPEDPQSYVSLALIYVRAERDAEAIATMREIGEKFPAYKSQTDDFIKQIQSGTLSI